MSTKKAILIVSVGTSHLDVLANTTDQLENRAKEAFPEYKVCQAFSGMIVLGRMKALKPDTFYSVIERLDQLKAEGVEEVVLQPTYIISGSELDKLRDWVKEYKDKFKKIVIGKPLLCAKEDYIKTLEAVKEASGLEEGEGLLLVGHGTSHHDNTEYQNMEYTAYTQGNRNIFVAALEGYQKNVILMRKMELSGCKKFRLMPLLFVAGKHAKKDIVGKETSWEAKLKGAGYEVEPVLIGLGEIPKILDIFVEHLQNAIEK